MDNTVMELVEMLYQMITDAWGMPLGADKCVIERDRVLDILDEIKAQLPAEIEESKKLMAAKSEYIAGAKKEAESIRKMAEDQARRMVDEMEVSKLAKARAQDLVEESEKKSVELRKVANDYAADTLKRTEDAISAALEEVRQSRASFRAAAGTKVTETSRSSPLIADEDLD